MSKGISNKGLEAVNEYRNQMALANGVSEETIREGVHFSVSPSVQQKLENEVTLSSEFLKQINTIGVNELAGETLRLGASKSIASRTDTGSGARRKGANLTGLKAHSYQCQQTNFDTILRYSQIDAWAKFKDLPSRVAKIKASRIALDRIMIGWHGTKAAKTTNLEENPLLQDVNIGWLKHIETNADEQVQESIEIDPKTEKASEYKTLDAVVFDMLNKYMPEEYRDDTNLVVIVGRKLLADKYFPLQNDPTPTEKLAGDTIISQKRVGGLRAVTVPYFPETGLLITRLDNLSIYYQDGAMRRALINDPAVDGFIDYVSSNDAYVVENYDAVVYVKEVTLKGEE